MSEINESEFERNLTERVLLAQFTTLGIGGPARYFAEASRVDLLTAGIAWAAAKSLPVFILGGGSNIVVADAGFPGLVLRMRVRGVETEIRAGSEGDEAIVSVGAGESWDDLVASCVERGWAGFECLSGIPGSVGATPIQNVGAYGQEISATLDQVEAIDLSSGTLVRFANHECEFGYRASRFKVRDCGRFVITRVTYRLALTGEPSILYPELERYLTDAAIKHPTIGDVRTAVLAIRRRKAMVIDPADADSRSVGSFFVNPVVTPSEYERIVAQVNGSGVKVEVPGYVTSDRSIKLSAAWLIERAGFARGYQHGSVGISSKHALAIVNRGNGTAGEVLELSGQITFRVAQEFGVRLTPEPVFVGFDAGGIG